MVVGRIGRKGRFGRKSALFGLLAMFLRACQHRFGMGQFPARLQSGTACGVFADTIDARHVGHPGHRIVSPMARSRATVTAAGDRSSGG